MLKWLPNAKTLRKAAFFAGGAGMAISTAAQLNNPRVSWVANLGAIIGGGAYSSFKSREIASSISSNLAEVSAISERLILDEYKSSVFVKNPQFVVALIKLFNAFGFHEIDNLEALSKCMKEKVDGCIGAASSSKWYVWPNIAIQSVLTLLAGTFNTIANIGFEDRAEEEKYYSDWRNLLNCSLVPFCIISQCGTHMFVASRLRKIEARVSDFKKSLLDIQNSLFFRLLELSVKLCDVDSKINECSNKIRDIQDQTREQSTNKEFLVTKKARDKERKNELGGLYKKFYMTLFKRADEIIASDELTADAKLRYISEKCGTTTTAAQRGELIRLAQNYLDVCTEGLELTAEIKTITDNIENLKKENLSQRFELSELLTEKQNIESKLTAVQKQATLTSETPVIRVAIDLPPDEPLSDASSEEKKGDAGGLDDGPKLLGSVDAASVETSPAAKPFEMV